MKPQSDGSLDQGTRPIIVHVDAYASDEDLEAVRMALGRVGADVEVERHIAYSLEPGQELPAITIVYAAATGFLGGLVARYGELAADTLKSLVSDLVNRRSSGRRRGRVDIVASVLGDDLTVRLTKELPDDAYTRLFELDLSRYVGRGILYWNAEVNDWTFHATAIYRSGTPRARSLSLGSEGQ